MPFPLPLDPADRLEFGLSEAEVSWKIAQEIYLTLPPGCGCEEIESALFLARVKLDNLTYTTNENN